MIIQKLLFIESEAQEAMRILEKEQTNLSAIAEAELTSRVQELEDAKNSSIKEMYEAVEEKTLATIAKNKAEYEQKGSELQKVFAANKNNWGDKIFHDVLYGPSKT